MAAKRTDLKTIIPEHLLCRYLLNRMSWSKRCPPLCFFFNRKLVGIRLISGLGCAIEHVDNRRKAGEKWCRKKIYLKW